MLFEFDADKSRTNKLKHGIDFEEAQWLCDDERLLMIPARSPGEDRFMVIGRIGDRCCSAVITHRQDCIRIISVRRSRPEEVEMYEGS